MPANALVTGPPRSGKTTALERTVSRLRDDGLDLAGIVCPEVREDGERVGFGIADLEGDRRATMAHVDFADGPHVGAYRVDVAAIDRLVADVLAPGIGVVDCLVIDEIAPMQLESDRFVAATREALDAPTPVLAAVASGSRGGFVEEVRARSDVETFVIDSGTRETVPRRLREWLRSRANG